MGIGPKPNAVRPDGIEALQMKEIELLTHHTHHAGKRGATRIGLRSAALGVKGIRQPAADTMGLALHVRDSMTHREEERAIRHVSR
jgi:hypothetical protein